MVTFIRNLATEILCFLRLTPDIQYALVVAQLQAPMFHFMNSEENINKDLRALLINCQIL